MQVTGPQAGPQTKFLSSSADIAIYGGAAGGGKSFAELLEAARHIDNKNYAGVIFRRTLADVKKPGSLWDTSLPLYSGLGMRPRQDNLTWTARSGAKIVFGHLEHETTVLDWQGAQIPFIGFDELTHFSRTQFFYMLSRNRDGQQSGVRPYIRATTNPDADSWVAELIAWWIDQNTGIAIPERSGVIRWFARIGDVLVWGDSREELLANYPALDPIAPKSLTFIAAKLEDNTILMAFDPAYRANLMALGQVERERLLGGNWKIRPAPGLYFRREWCQTVEAIPAFTRFVRGWDLAATKKTEGNDPDRTCGTKIGQLPDGRFIVAHHSRMWASPAEVEAALINTAHQDGFDVQVAIPQDPGQAGKTQVATLSKLLVGFNVRFAPISGDKITRFSAFSAQAEAGNVMVLRGAWNEDWFSALESFPPPDTGGHDDDADSTSEAFNALTGKSGYAIVGI